MEKRLRGEREGVTEGMLSTDPPMTGHDVKLNIAIIGEEEIRQVMVNKIGGR